jgi:predicted metalloendopeptidase
MTAVAAAALGACVDRGGPAKPVAAGTAGAAASDLAPVSADEDPCWDFASYACGSMRVNGSLLAPRPGDLLARRAPDIVRYLDELAAGKRDSSHPETAFLRDYHARCRDPGAREQGLPELRAQLDDVARIATLDDLAGVLGRLRAVGFRILVALDASEVADVGSGSKMVELGMGAPIISRHDYGNTPDFVERHQQHWRQLAVLSGAVATTEVDAASRVDYALASLQPVSADDDGPPSPEASAEALRRRTQFPWRAYLAAAGVPQTTPLRLARTRDLERVDSLARLPLADLKSYVRVALLHREQLYLGPPFMSELQRFAGAAVPLDELCAALLTRALEPLLAEAYLSTLGDAPSEVTARRMYAALQARLSARVQAATWLDATARQRGSRRVATVQLRLVGELESTDLDGAALPAGSFLGLELAIRRFRVGGDLAHLDGPPPALGPSFAPATYDVGTNVLWLSPEIARPPYVRSGTFNAVSFGALGTVIAHQLAHAAARATGGARTPCVERHLTGRFSDERIADIVGVQQALAEMEAELGDVRERSGWREEFFVAYAQQLCAQGSDDHLEDDPYPPLGPRINGTLAQVALFAETYHCKAGTPLAPAERCTVW